MAKQLCLCSNLIFCDQFLAVHCPASCNKPFFHCWRLANNLGFRLIAGGQVPFFPLLAGRQQFRLTRGTTFPMKYGPRFSKKLANSALAITFQPSSFTALRGLFIQFYP